MKMLDDRFWSKVDRSDKEGCWIWTAGLNNKGYGMFRPGGLAPKRLAHRLSYEDSNGRIPTGALILHSCDNRRCVNPAHLRLGSHKDNVADMDLRGRRVPNTPKGADNCNSFASEEEITAMRREYIAGAKADDLAKKYGFSASAIRDPLLGRSWRHLLGKDGSPTLAELKAASLRETRNNAKLTPDLVRLIKKRLANGELGKDIATDVGVHKATISDIHQGKTWRDV